jgi:hypothetical protein
MNVREQYSTALFTNKRPAVEKYRQLVVVTTVQVFLIPQPDN